MSGTAILVLITLFQAKHFICDGPLQSKSMVEAKSHYGRTLGLVHAALHGLGTFAVLAIFSLGWTLTLAITVIDILLHYHIDFTKENIVKHFGWTVGNREFWWALAADQLLHNLTYIVLTAIVVWSA